MDLYAVHEEENTASTALYAEKMTFIRLQGGVKVSGHIRAGIRTK